MLCLAWIRQVRQGVNLLVALVCSSFCRRTQPLAKNACHDIIIPLQLISNPLTSPHLGSHCLLKPQMGWRRSHICIYIVFLLMHARGSKQVSGARSPAKISVQTCQYCLSGKPGRQGSPDPNAADQNQIHKMSAWPHPVNVARLQSRPKL